MCILLEERGKDGGRGREAEKERDLLYIYLIARVFIASDFKNRQFCYYLNIIPED